MDIRACFKHKHQNCQKNHCKICGTCEAKLYKNSCKKCCKEIRNKLKLLDLKALCEYTCDHKEHYREPYVKINSSLCENNIVRIRCAPCRNEIRKELESRNRITKVQEKIKHQKQESLLLKCCKVISSDPGLLLEATMSNPTLPIHVWKTIYENVPQTLTPNFKSVLNESVEVNDSYYMYKALGEMFSRYKIF